MNNITWYAPAKLNLFLHINRRRADGYHELQTLFQFVDWGDVLHASLREDGVLQMQTPTPGVEPEDDLVLRAARLLQAHTGTSFGADLSVEKHLPMGGGIGGGSSDAAACLLMLNDLWGVQVSIDDLAGLGLQLGADVPVFVRGKAAWAEGVGEKLTPVENLPTPWFLIVKPDCHVSTGKIFSDPGLTRDTSLIKMPDFLEGRTRNDCQTVVCQHYPEVKNALEWLQEHAGNALLTGTGACVFASFTELEKAESVLKGLPNSIGEGKIARALNRTADFFC